MPLSLSQIRSSIRKMTGNDLITLPDSDITVDGDIVLGVNTFLNRTWWAFLNSMDDLRSKESFITIPTIVGNETYTLDVTQEAIRQISYPDPNTGLQIIIAQKDLKFFTLNKSNNTFDFGPPTIYMRDGGLLYLNPIPDSIYNLRVDTLAILADTDISGINAPREISEILLNGAAWRVFSEVNGNIQKTAYYINLEKMLTEKYVPVKQKEEDNYPTGGLEVLGRDYD